jgi:peptidyl-prolyl cis-trans isomerase B (cyclophilin B)
MPTDRQRRAAERRRLRRQLQRRAHRDAQRRRFALIASVVGTLAVIGIVIGVVVATSGDSSTNAASTPPTSTAATSTSTSAAPSYPCTWTKGGNAAKKVTVPSTTTPAKSGKVDVLLQTSRGPMTFQLDRAAAPCTVESFASLAEQGYYNSTSCHRLTTSGIYVLQCGDPLGNGSGGPGYTIPDEATGKETYPAGTIAMARTQSAHSGGSQFFIVYKDSPTLQRQLGKLQYTVFGKVTSGLKVVQTVAAAGSDNSYGTDDGKPKLPIKFNSVNVVQ